MTVCLQICTQTRTDILLGWKRGKKKIRHWEMLEFYFLGTLKTVQKETWEIRVQSFWVPVWIICSNLVWKTWIGQSFWAWPWPSPRIRSQSHSTLPSPQSLWLACFPKESYFFLPCCSWSCHWWLFYIRMFYLQRIMVCIRLPSSGIGWMKKRRVANCHIRYTELLLPFPGSVCTEICVPWGRHWTALCLCFHQSLGPKKCL